MKREAIADTAEAAADLLLTQGWCQGRAHNQQGQHCMVGAVMDAGRGLHLDRGVFDLGEDAFELLLRYLVEKHQVKTIAEWNDAPGRRADEVIDELRHFAKELRNAS